MDLDEMKAQITALIQQRGAKLGEAEALEKASPFDAAAHTAVMQAVDEIDAKVKDLRAAVAQIEKATAARAAQADLAAQFPAASPPREQGRIEVREPDMYRRGGPHSFLRDLYYATSRMAQNHPDAATRIQRYRETHQAQAPVILNDGTTSSYAGLVPPQYLVEEFAPIARAGRPFLNALTARPLPAVGTTFTIPKGRTGTRIDVQATQNASLTERDYTVEDLTIPLVTIFGGVDTSRQSIERGVGVDDLLMQDLMEEYAVKIDTQAFTADGTNGQHYGMISTTGVTRNAITTTYAVGQWKQIAKAISDIHGLRHFPPNLIAMHPRRASFFQSATDTNLGRPLIVPSQRYGPNNVGGLLNLASGEAIIGEMHGLPVLVDANIPTTLSYDATVGATTDPIFVTRVPDLRLWEDDPMPTGFYFEEVLGHQLTVRLVAYGYSAFSAGRYPQATRVLAGSGLGEPSFT